MKIRRITEEDLVERVQWMNNPSVYESMHFPLPVKLEETIRWYRKNSNDSTRCDMVFEDESGVLVAMGGITSIDHTNAKGEFYIFVNPDKQNRGIGKKASYLLCQYGFKEMNLSKIYLYTNADNIGAQKVYESLGFKLERKLRGEIICNGKRNVRFYYELFMNELKDPGKTIMTSETPLILDKLTIKGRNLLMVRDDILPITGGGSKARKAVYYEEEMRSRGYDACVTTGGIQSNHNRAIALMCAKNGWKCHLVYHGTSERFFSENGNALLVRKSGADTEFVEATQISGAMDRAMEKFEKDGYNPLYIHGGGHDLAGGVAFVDAVKKLKEKCDDKGFKPRYIFHASGTGSTQAGIAVGLDLAGWNDVTLIGISVARQKERGTAIIEDFANMLAGYYGLLKDYRGKINFITDYIGDGYEKGNDKMTSYLDSVMESTGIMFDTTYSGKALYGMMDYLSKQNINEEVLFWHTGGLMNLLK